MIQELAPDFTADAVVPIPKVSTTHATESSTTGTQNEISTITLSDYFKADKKKWVLLRYL